MKSHKKLLVVLSLITSVLLWTCAPVLAYSTLVNKAATKITLSDPNVAVEVPDNFYNAQVKMELLKVDTEGLDKTTKFAITRAVDVKIAGSSGQVGTLLKPMRLIFPFDLVDFKRASAMNTSLSPGFFRVGLWDENQKDWQQLPSTVYWNGSQGEVECETTSGAGRYALLWNTDPQAQMSTLGDNQIRIMVNYTKINCPAPPYIKSGRTLVPLAVIAQNMGAQVYWNAPEKRIDVVKNNHVIKLWIGSSDVMQDNKTSTIDIAPEITNGSTYVPLAFVGSALQAKIEWDGITQTAKLVTTL